MGTVLTRNLRYKELKLHLRHDRLCVTFQYLPKNTSGETVGMNYDRSVVAWFATKWQQFY